MNGLKIVICLFLFLFNPFHLSAGEGLKAIENAKKANKYLLIFFYKDLNRKTEQSQETFYHVSRQLEGKIEHISIRIDDPSEIQIVENFNLKNASMPFLVVMAPNGAITGGFPGAFTESQLLAAIVSKGCEECLKALQDKKNVLLCMQSKEMPESTKVLKTLKEFKTDSRFREGTTIVMIDPSDKEEHVFLSKLGIDPQSNKAVTLFISPPAKIIATYSGDITKEELVADLYLSRILL